MKLNDLHPHGTYAEIKLDEQTTNYINSLMDHLGIENRTELHELHTTIVYSKTPCEGAMVLDGMPTPFNGTIRKLQVWPTQDGKNCLVAIVDCPLANRLHQHFRNHHSASHDFDDYTPHITLSYDCDKNKSYTLPDGNHPIRYTNLKVKPLDPKWK